MGTDVECIRAVGIIPPDIWELLQGGGTGKPPFRSRDMGNVLPEWEEPGQFTPQGGPQASEDTSKEVHIRYLGLPTAGWRQMSSVARIPPSSILPLC